MTPTPRTGTSQPERHSTDKSRTGKEAKIDAQMEDSFPASDPPSFSGGNHIVGAPNGRESQAPMPDDPAVAAAQSKAERSKNKKR
jgi:hypothetical protein